MLQDVGWLATADDDDKDEFSSERVERDGGPFAPSCGWSECIWKEWNASDSFLGTNSNSPPLERIPSNARFLIDGNGLAFYLHSIAYTRHLRSLSIERHNINDITNYMSSRGSGNHPFRCPTTKAIMTDQQATIQALPCMLPLHLLRTVTKEFVSGLKRNGSDIVVFWDGPARRGKIGTDKERKVQRDQQESYLELFCNHGTIISASKKKHRKYVFEWQQDFPFSKLFSTCVRHALQEEGGDIIESVECSEEADVELAMRASGDGRAFVLAFDSDFFFYKDIQYIPLDQMSLQPSGFHAFVARRSDLANLLGFDNDDRLIDLALLMGNDYVDPSVSLDVPKSIDLRSVQSVKFHLQCHEDFQVTAKNKEGEEAVNFVRSLYNLHSLEAFPLVFNSSIVEVNDGILARNATEVQLLPEEAFVRDGIIRYLRKILDQVDGSDTKFPLTEDALQAFEISSMHMGQHQQHSTSVPSLQTRPTYQEMKAAKFIERCIARFYRTLMDTSLLVRATPPDTLMNRLHFHAALASLRQSKIETETTQYEEDADMESPMEAEPKEEPLRLPIDDHESAILENIQNNRVTIIHGETGCGKSSRVPVMLLKAPPPDGSLRKVRFFISQPRRIAAKALVERVRSCEPELKDKFALRMGHGWKEYETKDTQAYFVTTGYLVRLLANHPERFDECTHLVIDEVHERSVDTDILCLLCRRMLETNKNIRLVLMSATLATKMYRDYFDVPNEPIHVGVRRYPITEYFIEDILQFGLSKQETKAALAIQHENETKRCVTAPTSTEMKNRIPLAARLATIVGEPGSSVLIFVPGMAEIIAISESIEGFHTPGIRYTCFPIHGDIPFEEQMDAFHAPEEDQVKIIVATNAAESSVTLPNVDHVICLGLCRQIIYNQASHRQMLTPAWISQASATQRAGRTGRVRPGNVYRFYTRRAYNTYMEEFEPGEMVRIPLDSIILMLKQILHEEVKPVFMDCLEPPSLDTIDRSFQSLYHWNFITEPDDKADITSLGSFVSALGVDLSLGSFIGLGIQLGVAAEAIEMAAMMSLPKTPFRITSPMWLTPGAFNESASQTYSAKCNFDAGLYSEPMGLMNALWDYVSVGNTKKNSWCYNNNIAVKRWQQAVSSRNSLRKRVADFLGVHEEKLKVQLPPRDMPHEKVLILRLLKVWVFSDSIVECAPSKLKLSHDGSVALSIKGKSNVSLKETHLNCILHPEKHPFRIVERNEVEQNGIFKEEGDFSFPEFIQSFECRLLSYASEMEMDLALCYSNEEIYLYLEKAKTTGNEIYKFLENITEYSKSKNLFAYDFTNNKGRGIQERACGLWTVTYNSSVDAPFVREKEFIRIELTRKRNGDEFDDICARLLLEVFNCNLKSKMIWHFFTQKSSKKKKKSSTTQPFWLSMIGECRGISKQNLEDMLGRKPLSVSTNAKKSTQSIVVRRAPNSQTSENRGLAQPLFLDVPEGARILAVLASSQRKGKHILRIPRDNSNIDLEETYDFAMKDDEIDVSKRWKRLDSSNPVYVDDSVPSSAIHTTNDLYAVAANGLELQRGGMRVDGLTLLPPNPLFLLLSFLSFGIEINTPLLWAIQNEEIGAKKKINKSYAWLVDRAITVFKNKSSGGDRVTFNVPPLTDTESSQDLIWEEQELKDRLQHAVAFNDTSLSMGEKLVCFPERINELCKLFDGIDGHNVSPWESIAEESLTAENIFKWRNERKSNTNDEHNRQYRQISEGTKIHSTPSKHSRKANNSKSRGTPSKDSRKTDSSKSRNNPSKDSRSTEGSNSCGSLKKAEREKLEHHAIRHFDNGLITSSNSWFSTTLNSGEAMPAFPSTNILALLFQLFEAQVVADYTASNDENKFQVALSIANWDIANFKEKDGKALYRAYFINKWIPALPVVGRGKNKLPRWIKKNRRRPSTLADAKECVPPNVTCPALIESKDYGLLFESLEDALKMEAAFWLNNQFCHAGKSSIRHWYAHSMDQMIDILRKHNNGSPLP